MCVCVCVCAYAFAHACVLYAIISSHFTSIRDGDIKSRDFSGTVTSIAT